MACTAGRPAPSAAAPVGPEAVPGEYVVVFRPGANRAAVRSFPGFSAAPLGETGAVLRADLSSHARAPLRADPCPELLASGDAGSCSPNFVYRASVLPDDRKYDDQWGLFSPGPRAPGGSGAAGAWDVTVDSTAVVTAVLDTGADYRHPDLAPSVWTNPAEIPGNGVDDDQNGYVDDVHGADVRAGTGDPSDGNGHGTHVAGIIGARGDDGVGITGVAWRSRLLPVKFLDDQGAGTLADAVRGFDYVAGLMRRGVPVKVVNCSWGGRGYSAVLEAAVAAMTASGAVVVAAAGNDAVDVDESPVYPANLAVPGVLSVGAVDRSGAPASYSNYGASGVHVAAPGTGIVSDAPGGTYRTMSGTSMAAPFVSGALALLTAREPGLDAAAAAARVTSSGRVVSELRGSVAGAKALDVSALLRGGVVPAPPAAGPCGYAVTEPAAGPVPAPPAGRAAVRTDELGFVTIRFPVPFPFYGVPRTEAVVSPNGVLYFGGAPGGLDFAAGPSAPTLSVAALQTDLSASGPGLGVWWSQAGSVTTVRWRAAVVKAGPEPAVDVRLVLRPDGSVEEFVRYDGPAAAAAGAAAVVGLSGGRGDPGVIYSAGDGRAGRDFSLRFTPDPACGAAGASPVVASVDAGPGARSGATLRTGRRVRVVLTGGGDGTVGVAAAVDGHACAASVPVAVSGGVGVVSLVPPAGRAYRSFSLSGDVAYRSFPVAGAPAKGRRGRPAVKRASAREAKAVCARLTSSARS